MGIGMPFKRLTAATLALVIAAGSSPILAQQAIGAVAGKATDEAKKPYTDYVVQLRDVQNGLVASTLPLDLEGKFSFGYVAVPGSYLVELIQVKNKKIVCTEGPYNLTQAVPIRPDVNISCGVSPALWLLAAGAATAIIKKKRSPSK
jgi:hypothetical protein